MTQENTSKSLLTVGAAVDFNSVVAFFISKYETNLYDRKKLLQERIKELKEYLTNDFIKEVATEVKLSKYEVTVKALGMVTKATVNENSSFGSGVVHIWVHAPNFKEGHFSMQRTATLSDTLKTKYTDTVAEISQLTLELKKVLDDISNISRKEREVKGAIAEKTLRDLGEEELFNNSNLLSLIDLPILPVLSAKANPTT